MVKVAGSDISFDQGLNLYIGAGAAATGALWLLKPEKAHVRPTAPGTSAACLPVKRRPAYQTGQISWAAVPQCLCCTPVIASREQAVCDS